MSQWHLQGRSHSATVGLLAGLVAIGCCTPGLAQPVPDDTLGDERSQVIDQGGQNFEIDGGAVRARNQFHSFEEFGVEQGGSVYFRNPTGVENIFSRVTGANRSDILGTLGVRGAANLYLMNPNGILFGGNAQLDVQGSFVGTTANAIGFGDRGFFSANNPELPSGLLTVNPSAFLFNQVPTGNITNRSIAPSPVGSGIFGLRVGNGETLLLLGGNVENDGGRLNAFEGRVEIGAVAGVGTVGLNSDGSLTFPANVTRGDVSFSNLSLVDVTFNQGGDIGITARNIDVSGSVLGAGIRANFGAVGNQAGDVRLDATGEVRLRPGSQIQNAVNLNAQGSSGDLTITAAVLSVEEGAGLTTSTLGRGDAGNVVIQVRERVSFDGTSAVVSAVEQGAVGRGGDIEITTGSLSLTGGARLSASTRGQGDAGDVVILGDRVSFDGSFAFSAVNQGAVGRGGNIEITTGSLELTGGAQLTVSTVGREEAGNITIRAGNQVSFDGISAALSTVEQGGEGNGGNIEITTGSLALTGGAQLTASTRGQGDAGDVVIRAGNQVSFDGTSAALSTVEQGAVGRGGNIEITADSLSLTGGAGLTTSTRGQGNAGNMMIHARDRVSFDGTSAALSTVEQGAVGRGGNIEITTGSLSLTGGAQLTASTLGRGDAGDVVIRASDRVSFDGTSTDGQFLSAALSRVDQGGVGNGGNIEITTGSLSLTGGAQLTASTLGRGDAGDVVIRASDRISFDGGGASSAVGQGGVGSGGNVDMITSVLSLTDGAGLTASTGGQGDAGRVIIQAADRISLTSDSSITNEVEGGATGNSQQITLSTPTLSLRGNSTISAATNGNGVAGDIRIQDANTVSLSNSTISTEVRRNAVVPDRGRDRQGDISIDARSLSLDNNAQITASTEGQGRAGDITIRTTDLQMSDRAEISSSSAGNSRAGDIEINVSEALNSENGSITTSAANSAGGNITITGGDINLSGSSNVSTDVGDGTEDGGNIRFTADDVRLRDDSDIRTNVSGGTGDGGDVAIEADSVIAFDDSDIISEAPNRGGNITLNTPVFFGEGYQPDSLAEGEEADGNDRVDLDASGQVSSGNVITPNTDFIQNSLTDLSENIVDADSVIANSCIARTESGSTFLVTGSGGLPPRPGVAPLSPYPTGTVRTEAEAAPSSWQPGDEIVEPQGVYQLPDGQLVMSRECS